VIMNRVDSPRFPSTVCAVVKQGTGRKHACQFSYTCDGQPEQIHEPAA
ncbi:MAG TPA: cell wall hydrolase, partial [Citreicella sp.]|nr:cell wall hydrolase [Citreicella sp.]